MDGREKRAAERKPCRVPVSIITEGQRLLATARDLSRTGVRLHAPLAVFDLPVDVTLLTVARRLCEVLPHRTPAVFDPERLGPLVTRQFEIARVGLVSGQDPQVELGCRFHVPLSTVDVAAVGVVIADPEPEAPFKPPVIPEELLRPKPRPPTPRAPKSKVEPGRIPLEDEAASAPDGTTPARGPRYRVHITPTAEAAGDTITAWSERLEPDRIILYVPKRGALGIREGGGDMKSLLIELCEALGDRPKARIVDGSKHLWSGPVRLLAVETFVEDEDAIRIELGFVRSLRYNEKAALSIA